MFISWGSSGKLAEVGSAGQLHCAYCDQDARFTRMVSYTVRHVYWIFRWVSDRTPYVVCGNCGGAHSADLEDYDSAEVRKAIPLWDRRGWLIGAGGIGAIIASASLASAADHAADKTYVAAPAVGDIYEADLAKILVKPEARVMYSAIRVTRVSATEIEVEVGRKYYDDMRGVEHDLNMGLAQNEAYYGGDRATLPISAIQRMYDEGALQDVRR